ncbi:hypothetical protein BE15_34555 [Sorangium cellulosum]|uniref:Uncharacterized protein n=1 Tax=Sorangium cellulosum TaxID=56 RepID=A0A150R3W1_SORCE|nr:hypothetical protein BE15_34555 [Sorangium cellulosum]
MNYLDFDGPDDAPPRPRALATPLTPEGELLRRHVAAEAEGEAGPKASKPAAGAALAAGMLPAAGAAPVEEPGDTGLSPEQMRRKRRIFYAGLLVLGTLATVRLVFVAGC